MSDGNKLRRYGQFVALLFKYGRLDFAEAVSAQMGTDNTALESAVEGGRGPENIVADLVALGPTFVKLGQMLSTRNDLLTQPYLDALTLLQDDVPGLDFATIERILNDELGVKPSRVFETLDQVPLAAASLGQVHRATLRGGHQVAVKIQRPKIREQIVEDLNILEEVVDAIDQHTELGRRYEFGRLLQQFRTALLEELDYRQEAQNLAAMVEELSEHEALLVPSPIFDLTTGKVLVMDFLEGQSVSSVGPLARTERDLRPLARTLCEAYLHQILVAGFFHADPHPGNILVLPDNRLALIDLGMVAHIETEMRGRLLSILLALSEGRGRETAELALEIGERRGDADIGKFIAEVSDLVTRRRQQKGAEKRLGQALLTIAGIYSTNGIRPPVEISLIGKTLLLLDEVSRTLDSEFDPDEVIDGFARTAMRHHLTASLDPKNAIGTLLDVQRFTERLPKRLNAVLDALAHGQLRLRVDALDEAKLLVAIERIGNRIAMGLVLAALIIGAALLMQVQTRLTLFGYPLLAIVLFLCAAVLGFFMVLQIFLADRRERAQRR